jgi:hypothetical protein
MITHIVSDVSELQINARAPQGARINATIHIVLQALQPCTAKYKHQPVKSFFQVMTIIFVLWQ